MHLRYVGVRSATLMRYKKAMRGFLRFLRQMHVPYPNTYDALDFWLAEYINHLWSDDGSAASAAFVIAAVQRMIPSTRRRLPTAWAFLTNWQRTLVIKRATPMPLRTLRAMVSTALLLRRSGWALALTLGFTAFLRTSEALSLSAETVRLFFAARCVAIALPSTKTTGRRLAAESVVLHEPPIFDLARQCLPSAGPLFEGTLADFQRMLRLLSVHLGYPADLFTGYSLRRGGATWHYLTHDSLAATMSRGRWQREQTARIYLDDARATLVMLRETPECQRRVDEALALLPAQLRCHATPGQSR